MNKEKKTLYFFTALTLFFIMAGNIIIHKNVLEVVNEMEYFIGVGITFVPVVIWFIIIGDEE